VRGGDRLKGPCGDEFKRGESSMKTTKLIIALIILPLLAVALLSTTAVSTKAAGDDFDAAAVYKAKCQVVMKGKDGTPKMPDYGSKGINAEQAKALVAYMKSLKQ
jgi:cytochrome c5